MSLLSNNNHLDKLKSNNINIKSYYKNSNNKYVIDSNDKYIDNLSDAYLTEKDYYINNKLIRKMYGYDSRVEYKSLNMINDSYVCPNCKMKVNPSGNHNCPKCGIEACISFKNKDIGSKYTYDLILHDKRYILFSIISDLLIASIIAILYFLNTNKTYNFVDIGKVVAVGLLAAGIFYFVIHLIGAIFLLLPFQLKRNKINKNDIAVWKNLYDRHINYDNFYNNLKYELDNYYYVDHTNYIIDYDILDYSNFKLLEDVANLYLTCNVMVREVSYVNGKLTNQQYEREVTLKKLIKPVKKDADGNIENINCHNCGNPIDFKDEKCGVCDKKNNYLQEWYLIKIS